MTVEVRFVGHLGNNLFQYALGRVLAEELGHALICVPPDERPGFDRVEKASGIQDRLSTLSAHFADVPLSLPGRQIEAPRLRHVLGDRLDWNGHGIDLGRLLRSGRDSRIVLRGYFQRTELYQPYRERIRRWFTLPPQAGDLQPGPRDIVIHLRRSYDMRVLGRMLSLDFYEQVLETARFERVYVCGLGIDDTVRARLARFSPDYLDLDAPATLRLLQRARQIAIANSTFSWWGAWLSDAERIFFPRPVRGMWSADRPEIALEVPESRYHYIDEVALDATPVFTPDTTVRLVCRRTGNGGVLQLLSPGAQPLAVAIEAAVLPFAEWLAARTAPFAADDWLDLDLPRQGMPRAFALLDALRQRGAIRCDERLLRAYLDTYGGARPGAVG
jgi:hypothetical protein